MSCGGRTVRGWGPKSLCAHTGAICGKRYGFGANVADVHSSRYFCQDTGRGVRTSAFVYADGSTGVGVRVAPIAAGHVAVGPGYRHTLCDARVAHCCAVAFLDGQDRRLCVRQAAARAWPLCQELD